jgi:hypothetical protein
VIPGDGTNYTVASMALPQGSFVVSAVVRLASNLGTGTSVTCLTLQEEVAFWTALATRTSTRPKSSRCRSLTAR